MTVPPPHLILEVTRHCNYRCVFCYCLWHEFPQLAARDLSYAAWTAILDRVLADGVNDLLISGGEPLLRRDLPELIGHIRRRAPECRLALFTNGSRLTEERLQWFLRRRVRLCTSLPGLRTYGAMTGTRRSCRHTLDLLARARELRWPISVSLTATAANAAEFPDLFCAAALSGAASIQVGAMMLGGRARGRTDLALSRPVWETLKQRIRALPDCGVSYQFSDEMICACRPQPPAYRTAYGQPDAAPCPAGRSFGVIGPSGVYRTCLHAPPQHPPADNHGTAPPAGKERS